MKNKILDYLLYCSIPEVQKPVNEYLEIKKNFLNNKKILITNILAIFLFFLNRGMFFFLIVLSLLSFFKYFQLNDRLIASKIYYEEASWFDSNFWKKPFFLLRKDKLLSIQKIRPILRKIFKSLILFLCLSCVYITKGIA
jgi:hypothetical protein